MCVRVVVWFVSAWQMRVGGSRSSLVGVEVSMRERFGVVVGRSRVGRVRGSRAVRVVGMGRRDRVRVRVSGAVRVRVSSTVRVRVSGRVNSRVRLGRVAVGVRVGSAVRVRASSTGRVGRIVTADASER